MGTHPAYASSRTQQGAREVFYGTMFETAGAYAVPIEVNGDGPAYGTVCSNMFQASCWYACGNLTSYYENAHECLLTQKETVEPSPMMSLFQHCPSCSPLR